MNFVAVLQGQNTLRYVLQHGVNVRRLLLDELGAGLNLLDHFIKSGDGPANLVHAMDRHSVCVVVALGDFGHLEFHLANRQDDLSVQQKS